MDQNIIVTESSRNLRALGRDSLAGKWRLGVGGTVLFFLLTTVPVAILNAIFGSNESPSGISSIYSLLITGPMALGYAMFAISIFRRRSTSVAEVFYGFEKFGKALGIYLLMSIFVLLWAFPLYLGILIAMFAIGSNFYFFISNSNAFTYILLGIGMIILCIPMYVAYFRYAMSFYILADNPSIGPLEAIRQSKKMMKGNKWKLFCLYLSFFGWGILSIFTLFIGLLWLTPYVEVSIVAFYDIANGSLRPVRNSEGQDMVLDKPADTDSDPITVYREEPELTESDNAEQEIPLNESNETETTDSEANEEPKI